MKYYIGYYNKGKYKPITFSNISTDILSVINFTTSFSSEEELRNYLYNNNLIPSIDVSLAYVIEKGRTGEKYYNKLKSYNIMYTSIAKKYFDPSWQREYMIKHKFDIEFIVYLYTDFLRKYGVDKKIKEYFENCISNEIKVMSLLIELQEKSLSIGLKKRVEESLLKIYESPLNKDIVFTYLEDIADNLTNTPYDLINMYILLKKELDIPNIPTLRKVENIYRIANRVKEIGVYAYENSMDEYTNIDNEIRAFTDTLFYSYDSKNNAYRTEKGKRKMSSRNIFDLGVFLEGYESYIQEREKIIIEDEYEYVDDYEKEEFLEEEDFERMCTTSEEQGISLRKTNN